MKRPESKLAAGWWDYTTLDAEILEAAARLEEKDLRQLARPGFAVEFFDTVEEFYAAEALDQQDARQGVPGAMVPGQVQPATRLGRARAALNRLVGMRGAPAEDAAPVVDQGRVEQMLGDQPNPFSDTNLTGATTPMDRLPPEPPIAPRPMGPEYPPS